MRVWKPAQWAANPIETNPTRTNFGYDDRKLFVIGESNELGHVREHTFEYGTGITLSTKGPNIPSCAVAVPNTCPVGTPLKEEHRIRVDGLGRMIERYESFSDNGISLVLRKVETNTYVNGPAASVTHQSAIDYNPSTQAVRYTQDKTDLDGLGRPIRKTIFSLGSAVADQITTYQFRNDGTLAAVLVPDPTQNNASTVTYSYTFDSLGRPLSTRRPDASAPFSGVDVSYDGLSQTSSEVAGALGGQAASTKTTNDVFGRPKTVEELRIGTTWSATNYDYGPDDNVTSIIDPDGVTTTMLHDMAGRRTQILRNTRVWTYGYDKNGNMISETVPCTGGGCAGFYTTMTAYDALDRPSSRSLAPKNLSTPELTLFGASSETFTWDTGANGKGRMSQWQAFGPSGPAVTTIIPTYNAQGQQLNLTQTTNAAAYSNLSRTFLRNYNLAGAPFGTYYRDVVGSVNCQTGSYSEHTYDNRGLPYDVKAVQCLTTGTPNSFMRNTRNVAGLVTKRESAVGSGAITYAQSLWTYDRLGRVTNQTVKKGVALDQVARQDIAYFGNDDPSSMDHWLGASNQKHFNFSYDIRHQLTSVGETAHPNAFTATYTYLNAGRFATAVESAAALSNSDVTARNVTYVYSATDPERITKLKKNPGTKSLADYTYDDAGNQLTRSYPDTKDLWEYVYDGKNQLRRVTKKFNGAVQGVEEYWYNESNKRYLIVKKNASGTKTGATWFIEDTEAQYDATGNVLRAFGHVSMGTPVFRIDRNSDGPSILEYQFHGVANNTLATVDQVSGTINASFAYGPFGEIVEATNVGGAANPPTGVAQHRRRMNDKYVDEVSGLAYYGYRYYDKTSLTWTQADPLYRLAPDLAMRGSPRQANLYAFTANNPLRYNDPDGRDISASAPQGVMGSSDSHCNGVTSLCGFGSDLEDSWDRFTGDVKTFAKWTWKHKGKIAATAGIVGLALLTNGLSLGVEAGVVAGAGAAANLAVPGTAIVYQYGTRPIPHFSVEVEALGRAVHTEAFGKGGQTISMVKDLSGAVSAYRIPLPDSGAAVRYSQGVVGATMKAFDLAKNSCLTHCGNVLSAGGASVPNGNRATSYDILRMMGIEL